MFVHEHEGRAQIGAFGRYLDRVTRATTPVGGSLSALPRSR